MADTARSSVGQIPDMATSTTEIVNAPQAQISTPLPYSDPLAYGQPTELDVLEFREIPNQIFQTEQEFNNEPYQELTDSDYERKKIIGLEKTIKAKNYFFLLRVLIKTKTKDLISQCNGMIIYHSHKQLFQNKTGFMLSGLSFNGFVNWIDANGIASNLKETEILLKENVPFKLNHGYQLPSNDTFASQGVIRQQRSYQQIGFQLTLILESIDGQDLLGIKVENSDVMDISAEQLILQTFSAENVLDVEKKPHI